MIRAVVYLVPLRGGAALAAPADVVADTRSIGYLLHRRPQSLRLAVLMPEGSAADQWQAEIAPFVHRLAAAASAPEGEEGRGLGRRWLGVLVVWGGLLLLQAEENALQVLGGLWLVAGFPWLRQVYRRGRRTWAYRPAVGLGAAAHMSNIEWLEHPGLSRLETVVNENGLSDAEAYRRAAANCAAFGLSALASVYHALASGRQPEGVWAPMAAAAPPVAEPERQVMPDAESSASEASPTVTGGASPEQEGVELRTSSPAI